MNVYEIWVLSIFFVLLTGCEDQFRYPCQNPKNWEIAECKVPLCTATGTCPDMLIKPAQETK